MVKIIELAKKEIKKKNKKIKILFAEGWNEKIQKVAIELKKENIIEPILLLRKKTNKKNISNIQKIIIEEINNKKNEDKLFELRKHKNIKWDEAQNLAKEPNYLSAILLKRKKVDGVVCGIEYTTKETLRAALQVIGKNKKNELVSSLMIMQMKNNILIFGDCALNINPNAIELSNIAIDISKISYKLLKEKNINVALLSYSSNSSSSGESVEKVKEAYNILKNKNIRNIKFYGDIQFDAAIDKNIRNKKIKNLNWKQDAKVFIFPNLDSANISYKVLERCVDEAMAIGPIIVGLDKPMNDLSRGSSLESIKAISYITAFQSLN